MKIFAIIIEPRSRVCALQGVTRFIIAEVGVFYPTWVATDWETCRCSLFPASSTELHTDLIFLFVTVIVALPGLFFNKYLPLIDVIAISYAAELADLTIVSDIIRLSHFSWCDWYDSSIIRK